MARQDDDTRPMKSWRIELSISEQQYKLLVRAAQASGETSVDDWMRHVLAAEAMRVLNQTKG